MVEELEGRPPQPEDVFWKTTVLELSKESISSIEGSAKHLIVAASFLEGVYFHALSFSELKTMFGVAASVNVHWLLVALFSAPVLLWLMVLGCATLALTTKKYIGHPDDPEDARRIFEEIANTKQRWLLWGLRLLMVSFAVLFVDIVLFLGAL
jgi:hypothetical protein